MADLVIVPSQEVRRELPCGCALHLFSASGRENVESPAETCVAFTFCDAHRRVKVVKVDPKWPATAAAAVASVARRLERFTTDDVWAELEGDGVSGGEPRRMGAIMDQAARDGICQKTEEHVQSKRRECHGRPVRVWASLVVKPRKSPWENKGG